MDCLKSPLLNEVESYYQGEKILENKYGFFANNGREYILKSPKTPMPWMNVLTNPEYGAVFSQTGCGFSWWGNSQVSRLTTWIQDLVRDEWGKFLYLRDNDSNEFWSLFYKPCQVDFDKFELRYGIGYIVYHTEYKGIESTITIFVPQDSPLEIWKVKIRNISGRQRSLSIFSYLEWCLGNGTETHREFQRTFIETSYDHNLNSIFATKRKIPVPSFISTGLREFSGDGFHSVNIKPSGYEGDKRNFFGRYRSFANPESVERGELSNKVGKWNDSIASLKIDLELESDQEKEAVFLTGFNKEDKETKGLIEKYSDLDNVEREFKRTVDFWEGFLAPLQVETPDKSFDVLTNYWLRYQAIASRIWARTAYYQCSGGYGFRDQLQDSLALLPLKPELTKKQILLHAKHQFKDGAVYHWWHPLLETGAKTAMTDDLLWMGYITLFYIKETADADILNNSQPYVDDQKEETLYEHCIRAIDLVLSRFSDRGLPLIGEGDWNDGMSSVGLKWKGESIWLGHFLYKILIDFAPYVSQISGEKKADEYLSRAQDLKQAINNHGWDGEWFIRATKDSGEVMGGKNCEEGKIFLNAQTWAVMHDSTDKERKERAIKSVEEHLLRDYGPILFYPAYKKPDPMVGYLSRYAPGVRENGGVYTHAACWAIIAECVLKRGDMAYDIYSRFSPAKRGMDPELYFVEPYVTPGNVDGPDSENYGRGGWTWYSGSGAWFFHASTDWILGIRAEREGLLIDPSIPSSWSGFKIKRTFRGSVYNIEVSNPEGLSSGVKEIYLDEVKQDSNIIKSPSDSKEHKVRVIMG